MKKWNAGRAERRMAALAVLGVAALSAACQTAGNTPGAAAGVSAAASAEVAQLRAENGLPALAPDPQLERAALEQATNMARAGRMAHTTGWGTDFASRLRGNGIAGAAAENVAYGQKDLASLFTAWMNSQGHRRNILEPRFTRFGLAYARESPTSDRRYWAMVVGR